MLNRTIGQCHFWVTFLGAYAIFLPLHYLGLLGVPRRYYAMSDTLFIPPSAQTLHSLITVVALVVGFAQLVFLFNLTWSAFKGRLAGSNPWRATTLSSDAHTSELQSLMRISYAVFCLNNTNN